MVLWKSPPAYLSLGIDDVHIWYVSLPITQEKLSAYWACLSKDEKERANRFYLQTSYDNYVAARGILRHLLSSYLNVAPEIIQFDYSSYGKPFLAFPINDIHFNMSHSNDCILYAINKKMPIGIDVEFCKPIDALSLAKSFFSFVEYQQCLSTCETHRLEFFYKIWTSKEAFIKGIGKGLSFPLKNFDVIIQDSTVTLEVKKKFEFSEEWKIEIFKPELNYVAAISTHRIKQKTFLRWSK